MRTVCSYDIHVRYRIYLLILHYTIHNTQSTMCTQARNHPATRPPGHSSHQDTWTSGHLSSIALPTSLHTHTHTAYTHIYMPSHLVPPRPHTRLKVTFHQPSPTITPLPPTAIYYLPAIITRRQLAASSRCSVFSNRLNSFRKLVYISIYQPYQYITRISTFVSFISTSFSISMSTALMCAQ